MFDLKEPSAIANVTELQRDFGKLIAKVRHSDVVIIRNNQPVAALVSIERLEQMQKSTVRDAMPHKEPRVPDGAKYFVDFIRQAPLSLRSRILSVTLFGSYARGDQHADSDIDLLVITKDGDSKLDEQISRWSVDAMEKTDYDDFLSAMRMTEAHWDKKRRLGLLLAKEVERDGIVLWESQRRQPMRTFPMIRAREAQAKMQQGWKYLDVRSEPEFKDGHAQGAINIPLMHKALLGLKANPQFAEQVEAAIPKETKLVVGCAVGGRSAKACEILLDLGYTDVANIDGGFVGKNDPATGERIQGWKELGLPVE